MDWVLGLSRARLLLLVACAALAAGCSSRGTTVYERIVPILQEQVFGGPIFGEEAPAAPPREPTRAELQQYPYAIIAVRQLDNPRTFIVPVAVNGEHLVYQDQSRRGIVMKGGLITATHGLRYDLDSVAHEINDPIAQRTPLAEWPGEVTRNYSFSLRGTQDFDIAVACTLRRGPREFIEIVELRFEVVQVTETCVNPRRTFVNTYWADPGSGFIWKSEQWIGPRQPQMTVEIVRPYAQT